MTRLWSVFVFISSIFLIDILRLFYLQGIRYADYKSEADKQHNYELVLPASRGVIKTIDKFSLVQNQSSYLLYAEPKFIKDKQDFSAKISTILAQDKNILNEMISDSQKQWVSIARKVDTQKIDQIKDLDLDGIGFEKETSRLYPEASMAAHILGFVGQDKFGLDTGYFGLEGYYDKELRGKNGKLLQEKDVTGSPIAIGNVKRINPTDGRTLVTWIDRTIQYIIERKLEEAIAKYGAKEGTVTVMDPNNGAILGMATYPYYDPKNYQNYPSELYKNPIISSFYEPGSTFKVLVMGAGIEEKLIKADTVIEENGPVEIGPYKIRTWDNKYRGATTMTDVLVHSSNVGMVYVAKQLGLEKMLSYIHKFGFGKLSGIDLQEESTPEMRDDDEWKEIDLATASFGQGIAVTPIQMIKAAATIANGGYLVEPKIVKEIYDAEGKVSVLSSKKPVQVLSKSTASVVTEMMITAVDNGEAKWAKPKGYRIAGKTGTAQIPVSGHYDEKKTIASFVGFAPADNPKFIILVTLREPTSSQWGSETAAPLFFTIAKDILLYYGIGPKL